MPGASLVQRMAEYAEAHPEATTYEVTTELEAQEILLAIADQVRVRLDTGNAGTKETARQLREVERLYRRAVTDTQALKFLQGLTDDDALEIWGLKLVVPAILVMQ